MKKFLNIFVITLFAIIAVAGTYFIYQWSVVVSKNTEKIFADKKTLDSRGVKTMAKVITSEIIYANGGQPSKDDTGRQRYKTDYQFEVGGKIYTGQAHTGRTNRDEPIEIVYDPQAPENNRSPQELLPLEFSISYVLPVFLIFFMLVAAIYEIVKKYVNSLPLD